MKNIEKMHISMSKDFSYFEYKEQSKSKNACLTELIVQIDQAFNPKKRKQKVFR